MKIKILVGILVLLIIVNLATIGSYFYYQSQQNDLPPWHRANVQADTSHVFSRNFDRKKMQRLRMLMRDFHENSQDLMREAKAAEEALFEMLQKDTTTTAIYEQIDHLKEIRGKVAKRAVEHLMEAKSFLSPEEQRRFLHAIMQMRPGFKRGGRPFPPGRFQRPFPFRGDRQNKKPPFLNQAR